MWRPEEGVGPRELESEMFVNHPTWMLEPELRSCARAVCFSNHSACLWNGKLPSKGIPQGSIAFSLLCSVRVLFVIPSRFLVQVIRTWTTDNSLQAGKVVTAPVVINTQGFLPRSGGQVASSCFLLHSLANGFNLFCSCSLTFAKSVALTIQSKGCGESFPAVSESSLLGGFSLRRSNSFFFHIC